MTSIIHSANQLQQQSGQLPHASASIHSTRKTKVIFYSHPQIGNAQSIKTNNNAAIISLLNSAPAAMTSSTVVNNINNTPSSSPMTLSVQSNSTNQTMDGVLQQTATLLPKTTHMGQTTRKISLQSANQLQATAAAAGQNRLLNQTNLIAVNANAVLGTAGQMVGIQAPTTQHCAQTLLSPDAQGNQQLSVRVTMSALASQLASPPAMMSSSINPQNYNFAQLKQTTQTQQQSQQQQQQIILSGNVATTTNRYQNIRRDSMAAPSPGSDSNASNASSSNLGCNNSFTINPGFPFLGPATSPTTSVISNDGSTCQLSNQSATGLAERLNTNSNSISHHSPLSTGGGPSPLSSASSTHFMAPSPKSNLSQHIQVQSPASISPLSSPPLQVIQTQQPQSQSTSSFAVTTANIDRGLTRGLSNSQAHDGNGHQQQQQQQQTQAQQSHIQPQTTTLNLQGINLQSLQGAMATFPGLQNVQVKFLYGQRSNSNILTSNLCHHNEHRYKFPGWLNRSLCRYPERLVPRWQQRTLINRRLVYWCRCLLQMLRKWVNCKQLPPRFLRAVYSVKRRKPWYSLRPASQDNPVQCYHYQSVRNIFYSQPYGNSSNLSN